MKQDKMAPPGFYIQFFKDNNNKIQLSCAAIIKDDYTVVYSRENDKSWHTLLWSCGPRKKYYLKTSANAKIYETWWEKFNDFDSMQKCFDDLNYKDRGDEEKNLKLLDVGSRD
jgi:hypothetical protein